MIFDSFEGYDELIRSLILLGADVNLTTKEGWTPLFSAASEGKQLEKSSNIKKE